MRDVLLLCPQERDLRALEAARLGERYRVRGAGSDLDRLERFDPAGFLAECASLPADGVVGTKDQSALLAAILAERRGLPGPSPGSLLACQHKPTSRALQRAAVPEATPAFARLEESELEPPFFLKPVVGRLSEGARRVDGPGDLAGLPESGPSAARWAAIAALAGADPALARGFLAEELLHGREVTLEGYVHRGRTTVVGITDSVKYPGAGSFERFEYPSALPPEREAELAGTSARVLAGLGFDGGFFNVEFFVPEAGPACIVEVNGRIASQFAPLLQALHGRSTYDALLALACGDDPGWSAGPPDGVAVSYVRRVFADAFVEEVPPAEDGLELLVRPGLRLSEQGVNDTGSFRLAIVCEAGETREEAVGRARARARALPFRLAPAPPG